VRCRAIAAQFMDDQIIALFELTLQDDEISSRAKLPRRADCDRFSFHGIARTT
jgi:hypothetical protein